MYDLDLDPLVSSELNLQKPLPEQRTALNTYEGQDMLPGNSLYKSA